MKNQFGITQVNKGEKLEIVNYTFKRKATDDLFYFGMHKEKWQAIRDARLDLIIKRYGQRHASVMPISRML